MKSKENMLSKSLRFVWKGQRSEGKKEWGEVEWHRQKIKRQLEISIYTVELVLSIAEIYISKLIFDFKFKRNYFLSFYYISFANSNCFYFALYFFLSVCLSVCPSISPFFFITLIKNCSLPAAQTNFIAFNKKHNLVLQFGFHIFTIMKYIAVQSESNIKLLVKKSREPDRNKSPTYIHCRQKQQQ